ncbi:uncharacterized protein BJ171DRAFT_591823 [Polychytrium aggregatum]|uniref:uncharacterized protein n=1 Tax=Polychytrium aggregatum TaxID=110093 RepID=UPI0022FDE943|nr:uncharacterized protein BJ171DRAFT_591823 [Polychytrium aggregatum]KAI9190562.1 hypothetical protein BJ171DRAFT_591823 [Polychytrium aggregatum]
MDHPAKKRRLAPAPARPAQHIPVIQAPQVQQIAGAPATSQLTSDQITTASVDMIEPAGSQQVQATEVPPSKAKIGRRRAIPKPPDAKIFRGHPLADPYPWSMVNAPCAGFIGPLKPVIVMDPRQRRLQRTPLGRLTIVTLINGQRLCDAREAIALSDGRIFKGYESIEGIDITSTRNAINRKWGDTLHYIPAIYIKFAKTNTIFPFVDDKGFMQILRRGEDRLEGVSLGCCVVSLVQR